MNTKIIIYDDSCPLCSAYTNAFIQTGLIDKDGRKNFSTVSADLVEKIDLKRAVNEIPVIDTVTSQVWYGIDALLEILQQKIPFIKPIGNIKPVKWLLLKLYKFISYNRRVIVAGNNKAGSFDCTPDFNTRYRITFLAVFLLVNTFLLFPLHEYVLRNSIFQQTTVYQLQAAHAAIVLLNVLIALRLGFKEGIEYLGQINMLALMILLLTIPLIAINKYTSFSQITANSFALGILTFFALQEYKRRMNFIGFQKKNPGVILLNIVAILVFFIYLIL